MNSTYLLLCEYKVCWYIYTLKSEPRCKQDKPLEIREDRYIFYLKYCHLAIFPVSCLGEKCSVLVQSCTFSVLLRAVNFTLQLQQVTAQLPKMYFQIQHPPGPECSEVRLIFHWLPPPPLLSQIAGEFAHILSTDHGYSKPLTFFLPGLWECLSVCICFEYILERKLEMSLSWRHTKNCFSSRYYWHTISGVVQVF